MKQADITSKVSYGSNLLNRCLIFRVLPEIYGGIAQLGEQVTSKATRNRNAASKKLISRKSSKIKGFRFHGGIAQLGERLNGIQEVSGSIPLISTNNRP